MKIKLIAEIGWNHMGDMNLAKEMISAAAECGADIVKFQTWSESNLKPGPWDNDGRRDIYKKAELSLDDHNILKSDCEKKGVEFLTSIFCLKDFELVKELGLKTIKVPSHEIYNHQLISELNCHFEQILLSAGACTWEELKQAVSLVTAEKLVLMHCVSAYPCPAENVNLPKLERLKNLSSIIGYSGHFKGIDDAIAAICLEARYVEKHFTIDQNLPGRDNMNAILPEDLLQLSSFRNNYLKMIENRGLDLQSIEKDINKNYRGRWSL